MSWVGACSLECYFLCIRKCKCWRLSCPGMRTLLQCQCYLCFRTFYGGPLDVYLAVNFRQHTRYCVGVIYCVCVYSGRCNCCNWKGYFWPTDGFIIRCKIPEKRKAETEELNPQPYYKSRPLNPHRCWIETLTRNSCYEFRHDDFWECECFKFCWKIFLSALYLFGVHDLYFKKSSTFRGFLLWSKSELHFER